MNAWKKVVVSGNGNQIINSDKGICVNECIDGYYESIDGKIFSEKESNFIDQVMGKKMCDKL